MFSPFYLFKIFLSAYSFTICAPEEGMYFSLISIPPLGSKVKA